MTKQQSSKPAPASRRKFLAGAAAATAGATLGFPTIVKAQGPVRAICSATTLRPTSSTFTALLDGAGS